MSIVGKFYEVCGEDGHVEDCGKILTEVVQGFFLVCGNNGQRVVSVYEIAGLIGNSKVPWEIKNGPPLEYPIGARHRFSTTITYVQRRLM
jgi:hypothetical protein